MDNLIRKRAALKSRATGFLKHISTLQNSIKNSNSVTLDDVKIIELESRIDRFKPTLDEFEIIQDDIECDDDVDADEQIIERESFESTYFSLMANAKKIVYDAKGISVTTRVPANPLSDDNSGSSTSAQNLTNTVKLPTIDLPKFSGEYYEWLEYRDLFRSLIHDNGNINEIQKFHYLRASVRGAAEQVIKSLEFTAANYSTAWDLLCNRFNNSRLLIHNHIKALFSLDAIGRESSNKIRKIADTVTKHLRALKSLKQPTDHWDTLVIYMIVTKLDNVTSSEWGKYVASKTSPTLEDMMIFLKSRADVLETIELNSAEKHDNKRKGFQTKGLLVSKASCAFCSGDHYIQNCQDFNKLTVASRIERAKQLRVCLNCLRKGHFVNSCKSERCKICKGKHHDLLHIDCKNSEPSSEQNVAEGASSSRVVLSCVKGVKQVLLSTAYIQVVDKNQRIYKLRAILDSGSQSSFITQEVFDRLNLDKNRLNCSVAGINLASFKIKFSCTLNIGSLYNSYKKGISCLVLPEITGNIPNCNLDLRDLNIPGNIKLADPYFNESGKIDVLIGADTFWELICVGQIRLGRDKPILQKTRLGWVVCGPMSAAVVNTLHCNFSKTGLEEQMQRFWEIEECVTDKLYSDEEIACEKHFQKSTLRNEEGRFVVSMPFKRSAEALGDSRARAQKRFIAMERRLQTNQDLKTRYCKFMQEYIELGHMSKIQFENRDQICYYLPHHGVLKEESSTTKLRVVFDGSAPTTTGYSLNDLQLVGPVIQEELFSILLRFRKYSYAISADIEKMYRMVLMNPKQRALQRIIWREEPTNKLEVYELNTVTYGTASAAFLSIRCLHELANNCEMNAPDIAEIIRRDFYVDDLLTGADTVADAMHICEQVKNVLNDGCFHLRKWLSNEPVVLQNLDKSDICSSLLEFGGADSLKTLGLTWCFRSDKLMYKIVENTGRRVTKRTILSETAQIFDPLGLVAPCTVIAKMLMQKLWQEGLTWDESLPIDIYSTWEQFKRELVCLNNLQIPRHVLFHNHVDVQLHGFADASERAYGACIYLRSEDAQGNISVALLCAKSKVAPLKTLTIPRLELCAAALLARLVAKVARSLRLNFDSCTLWSDSTIVLGWVKMPPSTLKQFVGNRVSEIQRLAAIESWNHVSTTDNPADLLSRGVLPKRLGEMDIWWNGPSWLHGKSDCWPRLQIQALELPEIRDSRPVLLSVKVETVFPFKKYSSFEKAVRIMAYVLRFIGNCRTRLEGRQVGSLSVPELKSSELRLLRLAQQETFPIEIEQLRNKSLVDSKSKIFNLNPFLDSHGLIRVGGRLDNSDFAYDKRHPVVVSSKHYFTHQIFVSEHIRLLHAGPQLLLSSVRERIWPIAGRNLARKIVRNCIRCFRANPSSSIQPIMGNLPSARIAQSFPFHTVGVDYAGPYLIKDRKGRGCKISKTYICLFICFATKAIHVELVTDLTTETFILTLRRFVSRRGRPLHIYSDNGKNFVGANTELKELSKFLINNAKELSESLAKDGVTWHFIPAHAPHFGGLWEAGVRCIKYHLKRVIGNIYLTFEELYTLLVQVEAILNSRPLTPLSADPSDLNPLTPAHFLIGRNLMSVPDPDVTEVPTARLSRYQHIQQILQHFWSRWSKEYIAQLQQRTKWAQNRGQLKEGALVLVKEDNLPVMKWQLGRVVHLHLGADGICRVASIRTNKGVIRRVCSRLCPLPFEESSVSE